jgi:UV DNA damage endonuclease
MKIRLGYVAMSAVLADCSPSRTTTVKHLSKIESESARIYQLTELARTNLKNTQRLLCHNQAHDIRVFRLTSKLIPLATHPITKKWEWSQITAPELKRLGDYAREHSFRISAHPDHFTLLNSPREDVTRASVADLEYHHQIFLGMGLDASAKLVLHVGGCYKSKEQSVQRFITNYRQLPAHLKERIVLENDDKIYTAGDVLSICRLLGMPMVLDIHHHWCNNNGDKIETLLPAIFATWDTQPLPPKVHLSSPKDEKNFRHHADYVEKAFLLEFLERASVLQRDFDIMIEAKQKDAALFKLMHDLEGSSRLQIIDQASFEYQ